MSTNKKNMTEFDKQIIAEGGELPVENTADTTSVIDNEENELPQELLDEIQAKIESLRKDKKAKRIYPIVVAGDEFGDKPYYVAYLKQPGFTEFTQYLEYSSSVNTATAMKELAKKCWLDGDTEVINDDSLFLFGLAPQMTKIIESRQSRIVTFSKSGK